MMPYNNYIKRPLDFILSGIALMLIMPLFVPVALLIKIANNGPIFFSQYRLGRSGKIIKILKFRSMTHRPNRIPGEAGELIRGNPEITAIGKIIRRFKIDELPQLLSVVRGELSLIGPRPCLPEMINELDDDGVKRLKVRPGCSGLAQVNGNIHLPWQERWKYDAYYVDHVSFILDLKIILKTLKLIFLGEEHFYDPFDTFISKEHHRGSIVH